jgi:hypothetical protein
MKTCWFIQPQMVKQTIPVTLFYQPFVQGRHENFKKIDKPETQANRPLVR